MSDLVSVDESQISYHSLNKMIDASKPLLKGSDTDKYIDLGKKYLQTLVAEVIYFQLKLDMKTINRFYNTQYIAMISQRVQGKKDTKPLLVAMGMLCLSKKPQAIEEIISQLSYLINNEIMEMSEKQKQGSMLGFDMNKKLNRLHLSTDAESEGMSQPSFTEIDHLQDMSINKLTFNLGISQVMKNSQKVEQQIKTFMENKNYTTIFNHFLQYKPKTFNCNDTPDKDGNMFKHTVKLDFINFLNDNQIITFTSTQLGTNKQDARSKANRQVLFQIFNGFPFIFKDFIHCMKSKNTTF